MSSDDVVAWLPARGRASYPEAHVHVKHVVSRLANERFQIGRSRGHLEFAATQERQIVRNGPSSRSMNTQPSWSVTNGKSSSRPNISPSMESGNLQSVCRVVANLDPPTLSLIHDDPGCANCGFGDVIGTKQAWRLAALPLFFVHGKSPSFSAWAGTSTGDQCGFTPPFFVPCGIESRRSLESPTAMVDTL